MDYKNRDKPRMGRLMIKLDCKICHYSFEVSEKEFMEHPELYKSCFLQCGGENQVLNIEEIINTDIETTVKNNVTKWFNELGIEGTVELIERHSQYAIQRLYQQELRRRGVIK
jgi:hypothetical protein